MTDNSDIQTRMRQSGSPEMFIRKERRLGVLLQMYLPISCRLTTPAKNWRLVLYHLPGLLLSSDKQ